MAFSIDRTGMVYGDWKILSKEPTTKDPKGSYIAWWKVECIHCGCIDIKRFKNLKPSKHRKRAYCKCKLGPYLSEKAKKKFRKGYGNIPGSYFYTIKKSAQKRGLEFNITMEFMDRLLIDQNFKCKLSGIDIKMSPDNSLELNGKCLDTASLDRIDSSKGYTEDNVQWVYQPINFMKMALDQNLFIDLCKKIAAHNVECGS